MAMKTTNPSSPARLPLAYIQYMGAYWSISTESLSILLRNIEEKAGFDLYELGCKQLKRKPSAIKILEIRDQAHRNETL